jgi:hypothetical protein
MGKKAIRSTDPTPPVRTEYAVRFENAEFNIGNATDLAQTVIRVTQRFSKSVLGHQPSAGTIAKPDCAAKGSCDDGRSGEFQLGA